MNRLWVAVTCLAVSLASAPALAQNNAEMRVGAGSAAAQVVVASTGNVTVYVRGSVTVGSNGTFTQQGGTVELTANVTVNGTYNGTAGTVKFRGDGTNAADPTADQIVVNTGTATFYTVEVSNTTTSNNNKVEIDTGDTVTVTEDLTIRKNSEFSLKPGATLRMGQNTSAIQVDACLGTETIESNGILRFDGSSISYAVLTSISSSVRYAVTINGDLRAAYFRVSYLNADGIKIQQASTSHRRPLIRELESGEFDYPASSGTCIKFSTIDATNAGEVGIDSDPDIGYGLTFKNSGNVSSATNVTLADGDAGAGVLVTNFVNNDGTAYNNDNDPANNNILLFFNYSGNLSGEEYDSEPSSGITPAEAPGRIQWQTFGVKVLNSAATTIKFRAPTISRALSNTSGLATGDIVEPEFNGLFKENVTFPAIQDLRLRYFAIEGTVNGNSGVTGETLFNCIVSGNVGLGTTMSKVYNCTVSGSIVVGAAAGDAAKNNLASGTISGGTLSNNLASQTLSTHCVSPSNWDYHLKTGSSAINAGADLVASGDLPAGFNTDFDRTARSGTWDVGADEYNAGVEATWMSFAAGNVQNESAVTIQTAFTGSQIMRVRHFGSAPGVAGRYALAIGKQPNKGYLFRIRMDTAEVMYAYKLAGAPYEVYYINAHKSGTQDVWHLVVLVTVDTNYDGYVDGIQLLRDYGSQANVDGLTDDTTSGNGIIGVRDLNDDGTVDLSTADINGDTLRDVIVPNCIAGTPMAQASNADALIRPSGSSSGRMKAIRFNQRFGESDSATLETNTRIAGQRLWAVVDATFYKVNIDYYDTTDNNPGNRNFGTVIGSINPSPTVERLDGESDFAANFTSTAGAYVGVDNTAGGVKMVWRGSLANSPLTVATWDGNVANSRNALGMHIELQTTTANVYAVSSNTSQVLKFASNDSAGTVTWNTNGVNTVPASTNLLGGKIPSTKFFRVFASNPIAVMGGAQDQVFKLLDNGANVSQDADWGKMMGTVYSAGTVAVTSGSATVTGTGTNWTSALNGGYFKIDGSSTVYQISSVASATSLTLTTTYSGSTASGLSYKISTSCLGKIVDVNWNGNTAYWVTDQGFAYAANFVYTSGGVDDETLRSGFPYILPGKTIKSMWLVTAGSGAGVFFQMADGMVARLPLQP